MLHSPESSDILCICRSPGDIAPWQAPDCQKIRSQLPSNVKLRGRASGARVGHDGTPEDKRAYQTRLWSYRDISRHPHSGELCVIGDIANIILAYISRQPWDTWNTATGSIGRLLPNQTAEFISSNGEEVPVGKVGELCIKGPNVFVGYLNNPAATRNALTTDGYFKTGDVGYQDKDGNFYITDRVKELIKYKGFQVAPAELEGLLASNPLVNDVAVIGVYDASQATEIPRAYVVVQPGIQPNKKTEREIVQWLQNRVSNPKRLRGGVRFIDMIPKSASGKILRRVLKVEAAAEEEKQKELRAKL